MPPPSDKPPETLDYESSDDTGKSNRRFVPKGLFPVMVATASGVISLIGIDDRMTDNAGVHSQLFVSPCVYPFLLLCFVIAGTGMGRVLISLVRFRQVSTWSAILLLLNVIAILIPILGMFRQYWISLYPLTYRSQGAPGGF